MTLSTPVPVNSYCNTSARASCANLLAQYRAQPEAEKVLTPETIVVIPIGAESKEHGPHLKLKNDWLMAEYLKREVLRRSNVVVAPTVNYHYYPAFVEYPGSTTLRLEDRARPDGRHLQESRPLWPETVLCAEHRRVDGAAVANVGGAAR